MSGDGERPTAAGLLIRMTLRSPARLAALLGIFCCAGFILCSGILFTRGVNAAIARGSGRLGADLMVVPPGADVPLERGLIGGVPVTLRLPAGVEKRVAAVPGVAVAAPQYFLASARASCCESGNLLLVGFDPSRDFTVLPWRGRGGDAKPAGDDILIGGAVMRGAGATLRFYNHLFTVGGRLEKSGLGYFDNAAFIPLEGVRRMEQSSRIPPAVPLHVPWDEPSLLLVKVARGASPEEVAGRLRTEVPLAEVRTIPELFRRSRVRLERIEGALPLVGAVSGLLAVTLAVAAQAMALRSRRQSLGLLQCFGMTSGRITALVAGETLLLALAGLVAGGGGAWGMLLIFSGYIEVVLGFPLLLEPAALAAALPALALVLGAVVLCTALPLALVLARREPYDLIRSGP